MIQISKIPSTIAFHSNFKGISGGWSGWAIAHLHFGQIKGTAGQRQRTAILLAHPVFLTAYALNIKLPTFNDANL
jgi:hypothetical protein